MSTYQTLLTDIDPRGVGVITLNRPDVHNAFNEVMIAELTDVFRSYGANADVRMIVLEAEGKSFCAGADLNWMKRAAAATEAENRADAMNLATMLRTVFECPKPVIARVQGNAFGGGVGLIAACDIAFGFHEALFSLSEVKLGIIPSAISPYVINAIGARSLSLWLAARFVHPYRRH
jgi:methylglutaconyl-CoA hydratase